MDPNTDECLAVNVADVLRLSNLYLVCAVAAFILVFWPRTAIFLCLGLLLTGMTLAIRLTLFLIATCIETFLPSMLHTAIFVLVTFLIGFFVVLIFSENREIEATEEND